MAIKCAVYSLLLVAHFARNAAYYLPFLLHPGALVLILFVLMFAGGVVVFNPPEARKAKLEEIDLLLLLAAVPVYGLGIWFEWVVYQAYQSMKREQ
ncbi:hypothetical protein AAVH_07323 [Aphelenchoides avenae]|nr:hypothetical protein AAVH_07323 [Aphelenchus avenae]